jgi:hypothetical protein
LVSGWQEPVRNSERRRNRGPPAAMNGGRATPRFPFRQAGQERRPGSHPSGLIASRPTSGAMCRPPARCAQPARLGRIPAWRQEIASGIVRRAFLDHAPWLLPPTPLARTDLNRADVTGRKSAFAAKATPCPARRATEALKGQTEITRADRQRSFLDHTVKTAARCSPTHRAVSLSAKKVAARPKRSAPRGARTCRTFRGHGDAIMSIQFGEGRSPFG